MKKTLSILLAFTMLFALCVPSFAANPITQSTAPTDSSAIIRTDLSALPSADGYFTVTFPADTAIPWQMTGDSHTALTGCTLDVHLVTGKQLNVKVTPAITPAVMTATDSAISTTLEYALMGETDVTVGPVAVNQTFTPYVDIEAAQWAQAVVGEYTANLTFAVQVV